VYWLAPGLLHRLELARDKRAPCRYLDVGQALRGGVVVKNKSFMLLAVLAWLALSAAAAPRLALTWKNPSYTGGPFKNILVLALNGKAVNRAEFEDRLVAAISRPTSKAFPSYEFMPRPDATPIDVKDLRELVKEQRFDAIVVARLTKRDTMKTYVAGQVYSPYVYYQTFYGYYTMLYPAIYTPGYMKTEKLVQVEVNVYSTVQPDGELVWTATTNTFESSSALKVIKDLVKVVTKELEKQNVIAGQSK
jgi:hypothetical protein